MFDWEQRSRMKRSQASVVALVHCCQVEDLILSKLSFLFLLPFAPAELVPDALGVPFFLVGLFNLIEQETLCTWSSRDSRSVDLDKIFDLLFSDKSSLMCIFILTVNPFAFQTPASP